MRWRQLREIWGGSPLSSLTCADRLSGIIARFIASSQSRLTVAPAQVPALKAALERNGGEGLEKNFLGESAFSVASIRSLLKAFMSIGCVMNDLGDRLGTGFLIRGSWLKPQFGESVVFVTNAHVISERLLHYRTPTDPGSSGSPVFNPDWDVIALHHAGTSTTPRLHGDGEYEANEGISMVAIRKKLNA
jgi:hypothetical protein